MVYVIQVCWRIASRIGTQAVRKPVRHILLLCVQRRTPDDGQRNCPKRVEFYSENKFEKSVHLFGFIIRIYNDARSPERQILNGCFKVSSSSFQLETHCQTMKPFVIWSSFQITFQRPKLFKYINIQFQFITYHADYPTVRMTISCSLTHWL